MKLSDSTKKMNRIAKLANKYANLKLNPSNNEDFKVIMSFYFKIFKYLDEQVIDVIKKYGEVRFHSMESENLVRYSIAMYESNVEQCKEIYGYWDSVKQEKDKIIQSIWSC